MTITKNIKYFLLALFVICISSGFYIPKNNIDLDGHIVIKWEGVQQIKNNEETTEYLSIGESYYLDSLQGIPFYLKRYKLEIPHISYEIKLSDIKAEPATDTEDDFIRKSGFKEDEFVLKTKQVSTRGERYMELNLIPLRYNNQSGVYEKLVSFTINKAYKYDENFTTEPAQKYVEESILATGDWYKICVDKTGIYKLDYSDLKILGITPDEVLRKDFSLYGNGTGMLPEANDKFRFSDLQENTIYVTGNPNGNFTSSDYILFYGKSPHQWSFNENKNVWQHEVHLYSDQNCYFLTTNKGAGKRISNYNSITIPPDTIINAFIDYDYHQNDLVNIIESGKVWYGEIFNITLTRDFNFSFNDLVEGAQGYIRTHLAAGSSTMSSFYVDISDSRMFINIEPTVSTSTGNYANISEDDMYFTQSGSDIPVRITYNRTATGGMGWLNYMTLNVKRKLNYRGSQLMFRSTGLDGKTAEYRISNSNNNIQIWDITDRFNIKRINGNLQGSNYSFRISSLNINNYIAHDGTGYNKADLKGKIINQNLHREKTHDLVIVTPPIFASEAERLATFRRENDNLSVLVVTTDEVYNEFSSGIPDIGAIRNFMKMFYDRATSPSQMPRYLLLFGNGTYDNKDILGFGGNLIPTFQSQNSLNFSNSWVTDDFFGLLADGEGENADGDLDIGIGRLPVRTINDASAIVDKIIRYDKRIEGWSHSENNYDFAGMIPNYGDWRNRIALIADDGDNNVHLRDAEELDSIMKHDHPVFNIEKIYLDSYEKAIMAGGERYPEVNNAINKLINKGALLINYIGHGGFSGLAHERILTFDDIQSWNNFYNLPVFMTATCQFSAFDIPDPSNLAAGIRIILKRDGGAVALFTTTRLAWMHSNRNLNKAFMKYAFKQMENGEYPRLGDMIRKSKVESGSGNNIMNFVLLGDPSMRLAFPQYAIETTSLPDTMRAFEHIKIEGHLVDNTGNFLNDYNGIIYPTVYDKKRTFTTLANSSDSYPAEFKMRTNTLFKGKATVKNGKFEFDFIVPKDIGYNFGKGKISYYFDNGDIDGHGYYDNFYIGGSAKNFELDNYGPEVELFLNDKQFVSGDKVTPDPVLLAYVFDKNGINTTGQLGHDIVAILNNNTAQQYVLNDYYESDIDTYQSGRIIYPFYNMDEGHYTLSVRVWDVFNNPTIASIDFIVAGSLKFALQNLINFPNPFYQNTTFEFAYTQTDEYDMDVSIEIYNIMGKKVSNINKTINITGYDAFRIDWNATGDDGRILEPGLYIYNVTVSTPKGEKASKSSKLVIMK